MPLHPPRRKMQQRKRVAAAGERDREGGGGVAVKASIERRVDLVEIDQPAHLDEAAVAAARAFTALGATAS